MPEIDTSTFYLQPSKTYLLDDYTRFQTLEEVLREYVAMVNVTRRKAGIISRYLTARPNNILRLTPSTWWMAFPYLTLTS